MECPPGHLSPNGSPVYPRRDLPQTAPPPLDLSNNEKVQACSASIFPSQNPRNEAFTSYFKTYLQGPFDLKEAKWIILGPHADYYREIACGQLIDLPLLAYEFMKDVQDPLLKMTLFEKIAVRLAAIDSFDLLKEGFTFLIDCRKELCMLRSSLAYLELNNPFRAIEIYFMIRSQNHREALFQALYNKVQDKTSLIDYVYRFLLDKGEIDELVQFIKRMPQPFNQEAYLIALAKELISKGKEKALSIVLNAISHDAATRVQLEKEARKAHKRKQKAALEDPIVKHIQANQSLGDLLVNLRQKTDREKAIACIALIRLNRVQEAYYFAREIADSTLKEKFLSELALMLAKEDHFALIKEIFPQCKEANDLKLKVAYLYLDHKIERSIEIYFLLCSRPHRTRLFIQIAKKATSRQALDTFIGALITPFLDSGDIQIAIDMAQHEFYGIDIEHEFYRMGLYLIHRNKLDKIHLILNHLTTRKREFEALLQSIS